MATRFRTGNMVEVASGPHNGKRGVVTDVQTGFFVDRYLVKLEGVDHPVALSAKALRLRPPPPPRGIDAWIPGRH